MGGLAWKQLSLQHDVPEHRHEKCGQPHHHRPELLPLSVLFFFGMRFCTFHAPFSLEFQDQLVSCALDHTQKYRHTYGEGQSERCKLTAMQWISIKWLATAMRGLRKIS